MPGAIDIVINLHAQGGALFGIANCRSGDKCHVSAWDKERANGASFNSYDLSYDELLPAVLPGQCQPSIEGRIATVW